jgi:hypothetical protein
MRLRVDPLARNLDGEWQRFPWLETDAMQAVFGHHDRRGVGA